MRQGMNRWCLLIFALAVACNGDGSGQPPTAPSTPPTPTPSTTATTATTTTTATTITTTTATTTSLPALRGLAYEQVAPLDFPVQLVALPGSGLSYVATKDGRVWLFDGESVASDPVLDISAQVRNRGEQGLLSLALHPDDESRLFVHYSDGNGDTVVSEFTLATPERADPGSERVLLGVDQPASNHNGGMIAFSPDGSLLVGLGDGGGANDRFGHGQNTDTLLGGLVSLEVDGAPYPSLFAYGLRNPWRFWIDTETLYIADVGQNAFEEVSVAPLVPDQNFGWPITEGLHCFRPARGCDTEGLVLPVIEVAHGDAATCSIIGGVVYRGTQIPEIEGHYFYSDFCGGYLRSFVLADGEATEATDWTAQTGVAGQVTGFGIDGAGEMYLTTVDSLLKVVPERGSS